MKTSTVVFMIFRLCAAGAYGIGEMIQHTLLHRVVGELVIEIQIAAGSRFYVYLTESGAGPPHRVVAKGMGGSDGESYSLPMQIGTGSWTTYRLPLSELDYRREWGNQQGDGALDLQGLRSVDLHIAGGQGRGELAVWRVEFARK